MLMILFTLLNEVCLFVCFWTSHPADRWTCLILMIFSFSSREPNDFLKCPWLSLHHRKCKPTRPGPCLPQESACHPTPAGHETLPPVPAGISSSSQHRPLPQFYHSECLDTHTHIHAHTETYTWAQSCLERVIILFLFNGKCSLYSREALPPEREQW